MELTPREHDIAVICYLRKNLNCYDCTQKNQCDKLKTKFEIERPSQLIGGQEDGIKEF